MILDDWMKRIRHKYRWACCTISVDMRVFLLCVAAEDDRNIAVQTKCHVPVMNHGSQIGPWTGLCQNPITRRVTSWRHLSLVYILPDTHVHTQLRTLYPCIALSCNKPVPYSRPVGSLNPEAASCFRPEYPQRPVMGSGRFDPDPGV